MIASLFLLPFWDLLLSIIWSTTTSILSWWILGQTRRGSGSPDWWKLVTILLSLNSRTILWWCQLRYRIIFWQTKAIINVSHFYSSDNTFFIATYTWVSKGEMCWNLERLITPILSKFCWHKFRESESNGPCPIQPLHSSEKIGLAIKGKSS